MINRSTIYKLILNNTVVAVGNKADMHKLRKKTHGTVVGLGGDQKVGDKWVKVK